MTYITSSNSDIRGLFLAELYDVVQVRCNRTHKQSVVALREANKAK